MAKKKPKKKRTPRSAWGIGLLILCLLLGGIAYSIYHILYQRPVGRNKQTVYLLVGKQTTLEELQEQIQKKVWPHNPRLLNFLIEHEGLSRQLHPGRYAVTPRMTASELVKALANGTQTPTRLNLSGVRTEAELLQRLSSYLMLTEDELRQALLDSLRLRREGLNRESVRSLFFAEEYSLLWNISAEGLMDTIQMHHAHFWTEERRRQADRIGLTLPEVSALAAIVESESAKRDEYGRIARLYLNRLEQNMPLQSDPTVKFALGDFSLRRITGKHLSTPSPYNTYRHEGLTPGPIRLPRPSTMDSVLRAPAHDYIYMCAKEDFSGYHNFAKSYAEHLVNARRYQAALNARGIR